MLLYVSAVLVAIITLIYYYLTRTFNYWKNLGVVGPTPVPLFGNLKDSALRKKNAGVIFKNFYDAFPNEKVVGVYRMTTPCLLLRDLDVIKYVMIKDFDLFVDRGIEFSKKGLGGNLFHLDGESWRVLRNRFTPIFTSGKLKNMLYLMTERGDQFIKHLYELCKHQSEHRVYQLVQRYTVATISACAFGLQVDTQNNEEVVKTLQKIDELIFTINYTNELDMMFPGILKKINISMFPPFVKNFFYNLVNDVITQRNGLPTNRKDFMDLILELKQQGSVQGTKRNAEDKQITLELTEDVIAAQAFVFYAAGYETSATTMSFMLYELAKNPDIQDKLIADIKRVLDKHNGELTYETIKDMTYLEKVFDETLRMHPLVEPLQRRTQMDYKLPGTNVTIKKGTTVLVSPYGIHYDEKYYPNPTKFDPERHSPENSASRHTCAYMPFGVGPRNCIGMRFAKVQSHVCMIKLLSKFRVEPSKNTKMEIGISPMRVIIGPDDGIPLNIVRQKRVDQNKN